MKEHTKIVFVVPAYNEEKDLPVMLRSFLRAVAKKHIKQFVIIDDGSTDRTSDVARSFASRIPITVIRYTPNRGPGYAFRRGLIEALKYVSSRDVIVTMESDSTSDLLILPQMIEKIKKGATVCVASYFAKGGGFTDTPWWRMLISTIGNFLIRTVCKIHGVHTFSSFYRVYSPGALKRLSKKTKGRLFEERGFACMVEMIARFSHQKEKLAEVPMILVSSKRRGVSKMRQIPTILGYIRVMLRSLTW